MRPPSLTLACSLAGCAAAPTPGAATSGETWHYVRSNRDGSEPEHIYVHRAAPAQIEVYKMRARCTSAAIVRATIDPATGEASRLDAARLLPDAGREPSGVLTFDAASGAITAAPLGEGAPDPVTVTATARPWHLYDFDLATLSAATQAHGARDREFRFGLALVWIDADHPEAPFLRWLGPARATRVGREPHLGRDSVRYEVTGAAFGAAGGGPLWVDAADGTLVDAQWGRPNHAEYADFRLRLIERMPPGEAAWVALLRAHFAGCA